MSDWTLRSAWDPTPRHPTAMKVARCSECARRVGTWLESDSTGRRIAHPCGHEQTACLLQPGWWRIGPRIPLVAADGTVS